MINEIEQIGMVCFIEGILMATTMCSNRTFMEPMRHISMHPKRFIFFPSGAGERSRMEILCSYRALNYNPQVFNGFLMMLPKFFIRLPRVFPISPHFISY